MKTFPRILLGLPVALLLTAGACRPTATRGTAALLDDVESYINDRPDSALAVLRGLDTTRLHRSRFKARYYLLKGIALDKTNKDDGSFVNEMELAASWFAVHGKQEDRLRSYYYFADQQKDAGELAEASVNFSRTLDLAEQLQNWFFAGMAARNLSSIYASGHDQKQAIQYARSSCACFEKAGMPRHALYTRLLLANGYHNTKQFESCISLCDSIIVASQRINEISVFADALSLSANAFLYLAPPQPDSTVFRLERLKALFPLRAQQQAFYAWALYLQGKRVAAKEALSDAYRLATNRQDSLKVVPWDMRIAEEDNDVKRLNTRLQEMLDVTSKDLQLSVLQSVDKARSQYYQQQENTLSQQIQRERLIAFCIILTAAIVIISLVLFLRVRKIQSQQKVREQQARIEEKEKANTILASKLDLYGKTVRETLDFGFDVLNRLSDAYYHPNTAKEAVFRDIIKDYLLDISSRDRLSDSIETNINIIHDDVLSKLRTEIPTLREADIKLFSYCIFGFSYKAINAFYPGSSSLNTSYSRVYRLRKTIEKSGSQYMGVFLSFLERIGSKSLS